MRCASSVSHEQTIAEHAEAAVDGRDVAVGEVGRQRPLIAPERPPGVRVEGPGVVERAGQVHHAVGDERRAFESAARDDAGLERPLRGEAVGVVRRNLLERAVALAAVIAGEVQPAGRVLVALEQILIADAGGRPSCASRNGPARTAASAATPANRATEMRIFMYFVLSCLSCPEDALPHSPQLRCRRGTIRAFPMCRRCHDASVRHG